MNFTELEKTLTEAASGHARQFASRIYDLKDLPRAIARAMPFDVLTDMGDSERSQGQLAILFHDISPDRKFINAIERVSGARIKPLSVGDANFGYMLLSKKTDDLPTPQLASLLKSIFHHSQRNGLAAARFDALVSAKKLDRNG